MPMFQERRKSVFDLLFPMSMMTMLELECWRASSSHVVRWLNVSLLKHTIPPSLLLLPLCTQIELQNSYTRSKVVINTMETWEKEHVCLQCPTLISCEEEDRKIPIYFQLKMSFMYICILIKGRSKLYAMQTSIFLCVK